MRPRQRATGMQRSSYLGVSPPLDIRVQRIRVLKLPMARRRLTTVPGPDPVMPAAHERASTDAYWSSCRTAPELGRSFRRWPNRRRVYAGTRRGIRSRRAPDFTSHFGDRSYSTQKMTVRRDRPLCAPTPKCAPSHVHWRRLPARNWRCFFARYHARDSCPPPSNHAPIRNRRSN